MELDLHAHVRDLHSPRLVVAGVVGAEVHHDLVVELGLAGVERAAVVGTVVEGHQVRGVAGIVVVGGAVVEEVEDDPDQTLVAVGTRNHTRNEYSKSKCT